MDVLGIPLSMFNPRSAGMWSDLPGKNDDELRKQWNLLVKKGLKPLPMGITDGIAYFLFV